MNGEVSPAREADKPKKEHKSHKEHKKHKHRDHDKDREKRKRESSADGSKPAAVVSSPAEVRCSTLYKCSICMFLDACHALCMGHGCACYASTYAELFTCTLIF